MDKTTINLYRGDDEECIVRLFEKQLDDKLKPLDLSNMARFDLWATVRNKPVLTLSSTTGEIEVVDAPGGVLKVTFSHSLTKDATWSQADYDLQAVSNKGRVKTPIQGGRINLKFDVTPDMTGGVMDDIVAVVDPLQEIVAVVEKGEVIYQSDDDLPDLLTIYELAKI